MVKLESQGLMDPKPGDGSDSKLASSSQTNKKRTLLQVDIVDIDNDELMAATIGDVTWLHQSMKKAKSTTQRDRNGFTAIHLAAKHGRLECVKILVEEYNVSVDLTNSQGCRPLHLVFSKEHKLRSFQCMTYLLMQGAKINVQNSDRQTPLHKAASEGLQDCVAALVEAGADVSIKDTSGHTPIDLTKIWGHRKCCRYLSHIMWKQGKDEFVRETERLNEIKYTLFLGELDYNKRVKKDKAFFNDIAFGDWIEAKHLPVRLKRTKGIQLKSLPSSKFARDSQIDYVNVRHRKVQRTGRKSAQTNFHDGITSAQKTSRGFHSTAIAKAEVGDDEEACCYPLAYLVYQEEMAKIVRARVYTLGDPWNFSTNLETPPVVNIYRPITVRLGVDPNMIKLHDFRSYLILFKNEEGFPVIETKLGGRPWPIPNLPFEEIRKSLFPDSEPSRIKIPQEFKSHCVLDILRKRPPARKRKPFSEVVLHLREMIDQKLIDMCQFDKY
nr:PREDICTED: ankyrin repeat domain-containing protein 53 [Latimeria chalumnae]|eukprot:XP_014351593.1 PREDICTED: ankyrin repeat domain-containing protein 53 [Latimeria chalumnae]